MQSASPFRHNPLANGRDVKLVDVPPLPETHEARKPMRSYLAAGRNPLDGVFDALGAQRRPKPTVVERTVLREAPAANPASEDGDGPAAAPPPRWGRRG